MQIERCAQTAYDRNTGGPRAALAGVAELVDATDSKPVVH